MSKHPDCHMHFPLEVFEGGKMPREQREHFIEGLQKALPKVDAVLYGAGQPTITH